MLSAAQDKGPLARACAAGARLLARFRRAREGVSAVEFAMIAPILLTMWLGTVEVGQAIGIHWKSKLVARTLADLTGRTTSVTNQGLANIFSATSAVFYPYDVSRLSMRLSSVKRDASNVDRVVWSEVSPGALVTKRTDNSTVSLPAGTLTKAGDTVIFAETFYRYRPLTKWAIAKEFFNLTGSAEDQYFPINYSYYMVPRLTEVSRIP